MRIAIIKNGAPVAEVSAPSRAKGMADKVSATLISIVAAALVWEVGGSADLSGFEWEIDESARRWVEKAFPSPDGERRSSLFGAPIRWIGGNLA